MVAIMSTYHGDEQQHCIVVYIPKGAKQIDTNCLAGDMRYLHLQRNMTLHLAHFTSKENT
ncbi:MAG: hypothetical protein WKG03_02665 [Telluria sp.]